MNNEYEVVTYKKSEDIINEIVYEIKNGKDTNEVMRILDNNNELFSVNGIREDNIASLIKNQVEFMKILGEEVEQARIDAKSAKAAADGLNKDDSKFGKHKQAIQNLQEVSKSITKAQETAIVVQQLTLINQKILGKITTTLTKLATNDRSMTNAIIKNITDILNGAKVRSLPEETKAELTQLMNDLRAKEDVLSKQRKFEKDQNLLKAVVKRDYERINVSEKRDMKQDEEIARQAKVDAEHERRLIEGEEKDKVQDVEIARQAQKDKELEKQIIEQDKKGEQRDKLLAEGAKRDKLQDAEIARQAQKDKELEKKIDEQYKRGKQRDKLLSEGAEKDKKQDAEIARQAAVDREHARRLNEGEEKDKLQDAEIARQAEVDAEHDRRLNEGEEKDKLQDAEIARQAAVDREHARRLNEGEEKDKLQDAEIARQAEVDAEHDRRLNEGEEKDKLQDAEIARQAEVDAEHARRLNEGEEKDKLQDAEIARQAEVNAEHDKLIEEIQHNYLEQKNVILDLQEKYDLLEKQINSNQKQSEESINKINNRIDDKASKVLSIVSLITGLAALVITIIQFFI